MKRRRLAPHPEEIQAKRKAARQSLGIGLTHKSSDYDSLRPDRIAIPKPSPEQERIAHANIMAKMKECFGDDGGRFVIRRLIIGE